MQIHFDFTSNTTPVTRINQNSRLLRRLLQKQSFYTCHCKLYPTTFLMFSNRSGHFSQLRIRMQIWNGMFWTTMTQSDLVLQQIYLWLPSMIFFFSEIKLVSKPLRRKDGKWDSVGTTATQETIIFFHIGSTLWSCKCYL